VEVVVLSEGMRKQGGRDVRKKEADHQKNVLQRQAANPPPGFKPSILHPLLL
jgi:hypothetical protein